MCKKMKFSINDLISKYDQIHSFLLIWSHLSNKSFMEIFILFSSVKNHSSDTLPWSKFHRPETTTGGVL